MLSSHTYATPSQLTLSAPFEIPTDLLIGNEWRPAESSRCADVINPSSGKVLTSVADCGVAEGITAIDAAEKAAKAWAATAPRSRRGSSRVLREDDGAPRLGEVDPIRGTTDRSY